MPPFSTSDHNCISFELEETNIIYAKSERRNRNFAAGDYDAIVESLSSIDWTYMINSQPDINDCYLGFVNICQELIMKYIPFYKGNNQYLTYPKYIHTLEAELNFYRGRRNIFGNCKVASYTRRLRRALARCSRIEEEKIAKSKDQRRFFRYCNQKLKMCESIPAIIDHNSRVSKSDGEKSEMFANYFESVYKTPDRVEAEGSLLTDKKLEWVDISCNIVYSALRRLPNRVSTSPDDIRECFPQKSSRWSNVPSNCSI